MKIIKAEIEITAVSPSGFPVSGYPEVALAGKSNVGKSSLINSLVNRKSLARTSSTPGKTRTINFYNVNDSLYFVDLPGYGYAKVAKKEKEKWGAMIESYLQNRAQLSLMILLVDSRREPSENDKIMLNYMRSLNVKKAVVATKVDKLSKNELFKNLAIIRKSLNLNEDEVLIPFSAEKKSGVEEVWDLIVNSTSLQ
ncbi:MAG TPA: YihA family ribosome biogenesis GTP-binding protein [Clostridiaceae bacterium]|mgnify:CR=1 FL=1|nr:YihA family ribosome biogenesis GTP-binding protein [Clostridiaceae bacterium]HBF77027.1 YihA family ribosome biogenesis GTP-binding protein [Clostridiaceae bacterium]HBG38766.1 YihA family ribosome biogenesis GTP-binding protein [Clostridiaceae bacterium]HBN28688.1 YihA family ribosome biogenesis GTP-binding protein [Clostridiaceae bacterium]HBX47470.1 YihA family ribosome biogenesis GTP-binding protein [Clostridiaceae bacterium]